MTDESKYLINQLMIKLKQTSISKMWSVEIKLFHFIPFNRAVLLSIWSDVYASTKSVFVMNGFLLEIPYTTGV